MSVNRYWIENMRVVPATAKVQEKNPERVFTINGTAFYTVNEKGKPAEKLSITSKSIDRPTALSGDFSLDLTNGFLTIPEGRRGRTASAGMTQEEVNTLLNSLND